MRIGFHIPFSGSLNKLEERIRISRGNTFQIFARSLRGIDRDKKMVPLQKLNAKRLREYEQFLEKRNISPVIIHAPYSYNLSHEVTDDVTYIQEDLMFAQKMNAKYYVIQVGYYKDLNPFVATEHAKNNFRKALKSVIWDGDILIKNMSGAGTEMVSELSEWNEMLSFHPKIKGALDLGRLYEHGVTFDTYEKAKSCVELIEEKVGWDKIEVIYLNDSIRQAGDRKNKFVPLGEGMINYKGYQHLLSFDELKQKVWIVENQSVEHYDKTIEFVLSFYE